MTASAVADPELIGQQRRREGARRSRRGRRGSGRTPIARPRSSSGTSRWRTVARMTSSRRIAPTATPIARSAGPRSCVVPRTTSPSGADERARRRSRRRAVAGRPSRPPTPAAIPPMPVAAFRRPVAASPAPSESTAMTTVRTPSAPPAKLVAVSRTMIPGSRRTIVPQPRGDRRLDLGRAFGASLVLGRLDQRPAAREGREHHRHEREGRRVEHEGDRPDRRSR